MKTNAQIAQELRERIDAELSDPAQVDVDLVAACVDTILELDGIEPETDEEVRAGIESVLHAQPNGRKRRRLRRVLIAAVAAVLIVSCSTPFMPLGTNDESLLHKWVFFLYNQGPGYSMDFGDYCTLISSGKIETFKSIRQFVRKTGADVLVPTVLPHKAGIRKVVIGFDYLYDCPFVDFTTYDPKVSVSVYIGYTHDNLDSYERAEQIGGHVCGIAVADRWYQADFNYDGNSYTVSAHSYDDLVSIIENLQNSQELYCKGK